MCVHVSVENLVANAFIELLSKGDGGSTFISFESLDAYGITVANDLRRKDEDVIWIYSQANKIRLFKNFSDFFKRDMCEGKQGIRLLLRDGNDKSGTLDALWDRFRANTATDLVAAFASREALSALGIVA